MEVPFPRLENRSYIVSYVHHHLQASTAPKPLLVYSYSWVHLKILTLTVRAYSHSHDMQTDSYHQKLVLQRKCLNLQKVKSSQFLYRISLLSCLHIVRDYCRFHKRENQDEERNQYNHHDAIAFREFFQGCFYASVVTRKILNNKVYALCD